MKFRNLGRALALIAGFAGITLGLTSCADHTVGYVYVLGTQYNQISELQEDNNNGILKSIKGNPVSSGGADPIRAVTPTGNRFLYVLNAGTPMTDTTQLLPTGAPNPDYGSVTYSSGNITVFSIGGYGQLSQQIQYTSQGFGSQRLAVDAAGAHLFVLDEYAPVGITAGSSTSPTASPAQSTNYPCLGSDSLYHPTGDITVYDIDPATGRLTVQPNARNEVLTYFPVGCFPVDFRLTSAYVYTMDAGSTTNNDVQTINVQSVSTAGQLAPTQTNVIPIRNTNAPGTIPQISAVNGNGSTYLYLIDTVNDDLYLYTINAGSGALTAVTGAAPYNNGTNTAAGGPVQTVVDSTGKFLFVANGGTPLQSTTNGGTTPAADIGVYNIDATTGLLDTPSAGSPFTAGDISGPVCIFEDPTNQYIYSAGSNDNSITGRKLDPNTGTLKDLNKATAFSTVGTPSWCLAISSTF
jgi:6-phosphogluconolactonase